MAWTPAIPFYQKHLGFIRVRKTADYKVRGLRLTLQRIAVMFAYSYHLPPDPGGLVVATSVSRQVEESPSLILKFGDS